MSELILPTHLRPVIQNFNELHVRNLQRLPMIESLIATLRGMPEEHFGNPQNQPVLTTTFAVTVEVTGVLSALLTLQSAEADQLMQESPGTYSIDSAVAQAIPLLLWLTHGMHNAVRQSIALPGPATTVHVPLSQNRHTLERTCSAVDQICHTLRKRFPGAVPLPEHVQ